MATGTTLTHSRPLVGGWAALLLVWGVAAVPAAVGAQAVDTVGTRAGGGQLHPVVGVMGGVFDVHGGPRWDVLGARAGLGFGEIFRVTGFYWRSVDRAEREVVDGHGWGGEGQLNLNTGFGLTPFVTAGIARVRGDAADDRNAAILGAGFMVPLGPIQLTVGARDYLFGLSGLDAAETGETTHNWLYSVGVDATLGRVRVREPVVVARAPRAGVVVDTVWVDSRGQIVAPAPARPAARAETDLREARGYQSDRTIQVPIPTEGSITLRYGPETASAPAGVAQISPAAGQAPTVADPQTGAGAVAGLSEAAVQRIIDGTVAALLPRLDARDLERQRQLRADLTAALSSQRELVQDMVRQELARLPAVSPPAYSPGAPARAHAAAPYEPGLAADMQRAADRLAAARAELARIEAARADPLMAGPPPGAETLAAPGDLLAALVDLAARHPVVLTTLAVERGAAIVVTDVAFEPGTALLDERARAALGGVAAALRGAPGRPIYVQGHMDGAGPEVRSQQLSELRAEVVRSLLVQGGVDPASLYAIGFGAGRPVATNETAAGRALNRRVEIVIGGAGMNGDLP
jgi:outer membrane protein OmpA-like peptidoglycan-associated protein